MCHRTLTFVLAVNKMEPRGERKKRSYMMNFDIWCKSFLSIYSLLPTLTDAIDRLVMTQAICSSDYAVDTLTQGQKVVQLSQYKVNLINLKLLTEKTLQAMPRDSARLVISRYIDGMPVKDCIEISGLSKRSYFRHLGSALKVFESVFKKVLDSSSPVVRRVLKDEFWNDIFDKIGQFNSTGKQLPPQPEVVCGFILRKMRKFV